MPVARRPLPVARRTEVARLLGAMVVGVFVQHAAGVARSRLRARAASAHTGGVPDATAGEDGAGRGTRPPSDAPPTAVTSASFAVPAEAVWRYRLDFANLPEYNPDVTGVARVQDGDRDGVGGVHGPGARYTFKLADARRPGVSHPVELWTVRAAEPTLVAAGMVGGNEAFEEFVVRPAGADASEATLTLWVTLPDGLSDDAAAAAAGSLEQIRKELRLMKELLEGRAETPSRP